MSLGTASGTLAPVSPDMEAVYDDVCAKYPEEKSPTSDKFFHLYFKNLFNSCNTYNYFCSVHARVEGDC